jgi:hypothetical protein
LLLFEVQPLGVRLQAAGESRMRLRARLRLRQAVCLQRLRLLRPGRLSP